MSALRAPQQGHQDEEAAPASPEKVHPEEDQLILEYENDALLERTPCGHKLGEIASISECEENRCLQLNRCRRYHDFREIILARDEKCVDCGATQGLEIHHVLARRVAPSLVLDPENCVTLCRWCHQRRHDEAQARYESSPIDTDSPYSTDEWVLCAVCGVNYHRGRFKTCYSCWEEKCDGGLAYTW